MDHIDSNTFVMNIESLVYLQQYYLSFYYLLTKDLHHEPGQELARLENPNPVQNTVMCPDCNSTIKADLTSSQYKEYEEEARVRYLKAQKVGQEFVLHVKIAKIFSLM